jgi:hypothetical protein
LNLNQTAVLVVAPIEPPAEQEAVPMRILAEVAAAQTQLECYRVLLRVRAAGADSCWLLPPVAE